MKKLAVALALSLVGRALAGGGGPRPESAFQLAAGQVWAMTYRMKDGQTGQKTLTLLSEAIKSPDSHGVRAFQLSQNSVEAMAIWPGARYLVVGLMTPHLICAVPNQMGHTGGYLITGPEETWKAAVPYQQGHDPTDREIYAGAKKANLGSCTLKRLR